MVKQKRIELYQKAVTKWGFDTQVLMVIEELSELIQVLCKLDRKYNGVDEGEIAEEVADVEIMLDQLTEVMLPIRFHVELCKQIKLDRLEKLLES